MQVVSQQTVLATTSGVAMTLEGLPDGVEYFAFEASTLEASGGANVRVQLNTRAGALVTPTNAGEFGPLIAPLALYPSARLRKTDYPTPTAGPKFFSSAGTVSVLVTLYALSDGE